MITLEQQRIIATALADAETRRTNAGYDGAMHDYGAGLITQAVDVWKAGLEQRVPDCLQEYQVQAAREADPEWVEYQRLKKKFR